MDLIDYLLCQKLITGYFILGQLIVTFQWTHSLQRTLPYDINYRAFCIGFLIYRSIVILGVGAFVYSYVRSRAYRADYSQSQYDRGKDHSWIQQHCGLDRGMSSNKVESFNTYDYSERSEVIFALYAHIREAGWASCLCAGFRNGSNGPGSSPDWDTTLCSS